MKNRIVSFIQLLRESNIRISIAESIEACRALQICEVYNKQQFKVALQATLIKQEGDINTFNKIFDLYFVEPYDEDINEEISEKEFESLIKQLEDQINNNDFEDLQKQQNKNSNKLNQMPSSWLDEVEQFDKNKKNKDIFKQGSESDLQQLAEQIANSRNFEDWESEDIDATCERMIRDGNLESCKFMAKNEVRKSQQMEIEQKYNKLKEMLKEEIEKTMVRQFGNEIIKDIIDNSNLMDKDLGQLTTEELEKIQQIIKKIAKKLATHVSRKEKHSKKGRINIRGTIRKSMQYGTTSSELKFKNKKKTKSELIVLCDISGSVWMYVGFMLQLAIGIQNVFSKVNSYIFIDHIKNVTEKILNSENLGITMNEFLYDHSLGYGTDYGNVFYEFSKEKGVFNKKTILIIMGDAENTGNTTGEEYLKKISDECKKVYWLHPKDKQYWYPSSYSELYQLHTYEKYCKEVYQCSTLRQLEDFIKKLIKL